MGGKQSSAGRSRAAFPGGVSTDDSAVPSAAHFGHFRAGGAMGIRSRSVSSVAAMGMESSGGVPFGFYASRASSDPERAGGASESAAGTEVEPRGDGMLFLGTDTLPLHIGPRWFRAPSGFKCPICSKSVASNEMEVHFLMCLSKPRLSYNDDVLSKDTGECVICLEDLQQGDTIARLPCLCIYHKRAIASQHCRAVVQTRALTDSNRNSAAGQKTRGWTGVVGPLSRSPPCGMQVSLASHIHLLLSPGPVSPFLPTAAFWSPSSRSSH